MASTRLGTTPIFAAAIVGLVSAAGILVVTVAGQPAASDVMPTRLASFLVQKIAPASLAVPAVRVETAGEIGNWPLNFDMPSSVRCHLEAGGVPVRDDSPFVLRVEIRRTSPDSQLLLITLREPCVPLALPDNRGMTAVTWEARYFTDKARQDPDGGRFDIALKEKQAVADFCRAYRAHPAH